MKLTTPDLVAYRGKTQTSQPPTKPTLPSISRQPSAPPTASSRSIAAMTTAPVSIPVPEEAPAVPSLDIGFGDDFGAGFGGTGSGPGSGSGFGSRGSLDSALVGRLYDFKQRAGGTPNTDYPTDKAAISRGDEYVKIITDLHDRKFPDSMLNDYFRAPFELSLTHLAIPYSNAAEGPRYFGAEEEIKPSGWMAQYHGTVIVPESGRYRFVGAADDYLSVTINGKVRLYACWPSIQQRIAGDWDKKKKSGEWDSPLANARLIAGDWINLRAGQKIEMELAIGERPGGMVGFLLQVEKANENYRKGPNGRPILPLFTTQALDPATQQDIKSKFGSYEFEWEKVPVFRSAKSSKR
ncbi:hypothetical protein [Roseibacillus persicicus]|uniref:hypothetical protein n=1 Tax=Roseibacillus persicicus TaxID=454148 RepID=UPI00280DE17E|nr:hypothetical protein [Roseibacillus persicicus]MDQ8191680.1 hypothetical protein [Roseibacillus persicicus]